MPPRDHFTLGEPRVVDLSSLDVVLLRQDPPFDLAYISTTHMLERIHPKTLVVNDPAHVRNAPEKIFVTEFPDLMPPTLDHARSRSIKAFRAQHGDIVMKPLYGKGGEAVFRVGRRRISFRLALRSLRHDVPEPWVVQKFLPAVKDGDKRIILVDGEFGGASTACRRLTISAPTWWRRRTEGDGPHAAGTRNLRPGHSTVSRSRTVQPVASVYQPRMLERRSSGAGTRLTAHRIRPAAPPPSRNIVTKGA